MTVPFNLPLFTVAAAQSARASHVRREEKEADDQRYATLRREQAQLRSLEDEPLLVDEPMIEQNYPITAPPELVEQWRSQAPAQFGLPRETFLVTLAARWGADQELEACCQYIGNEGEWFATPEFRLAELRAARRPKPPSPKEEALRLLENLAETRRIVDPEYQALRHALEALPND